MIHAELRGKRGDEDRLTSIAFGLLRYLPAADGFLPLLRRTRPVSLAASPDLSAVVRVEVEFWRYTTTHGEPDVILRLFDDAGLLRWVVLVEVKLHSAKSSRAIGGYEDADTDAPDPDQLVKYWQLLTGLDEVRAGATPYLIYLTKHAIPPADELNESLARNPTMVLGWLSWRDVWAVAKRAETSSLPAADLARVLAHKGLKRFEGFTRATWVPPAHKRFRTTCGWFSRLSHWQLPTVRTFWRGQP
jgi:hypothetical protein